jgi:hypothetical protein
MALVYETGQIGLLADWPLNNTIAAPGVGSEVIDATGEKFGFIGNVWHPTIKTGTINIRKVHFRCSAVTLNAASEIRVSLQNVSGTAGPVYQPDGVQDQFYDFKTATTALTANAWNTTGALSGDRAVNLASDSRGDTDSRRLAVVFEFQVFTAADTVQVNGATTSSNLAQMGGVLLNTGSWTIVSNRSPMVAFECDDGSYAFMGGALPFSATSSVSVSSTAAVRRAGVKFQVPTTRTLDRVAMTAVIPNSCDGRFVLYDSDGTTELRSIDIDNDDVRSVSTTAYIDLVWEPVTLLANTYYRMAFVGGTATSASIHYMDVNAAGIMDGFVLGQDAHWTEADSAGTWTDTTTRRPVFGLGFGAYDNGAGGSGGLMVHPGMNGGIRG